MDEIESPGAKLTAEIVRLVDKRLRFIRDNRERLLEAWIAETGCLPSEGELVETHHPDGLTVTVHVRRREVPPQPPQTLR